MGSLINEQGVSFVINGSAFNILNTQETNSIIRKFKTD